MWSNQENRVRKQVKNPCEARKNKASQILHKIISTHLLIVLTIRVLLQIEQKKRDRDKKMERKSLRCPSYQPGSELKTYFKIDHKRKGRDDLC